MEGWNGEGADQVPAVTSYGACGLLHFFLSGSFLFPFAWGLGSIQKHGFCYYLPAYTLHMPNEHRYLARGLILLLIVAWIYHTMSI
jgi:hypothetical protein